MFKRILVAIDGSSHAEQALREAADLARQGDGRLTLITCAPDLSAWTLTGSAYAGVDFERLEDDERSRYEELLDAAVAQVGDGVATDTVLTHGHAAEAIIAQVDEGGHDLVVMGSRGRGPMRSLVLGSVSHQVLNASPAAVLIIHAEEEPPS